MNVSRKQLLALPLCLCMFATALAADPKPQSDDSAKVGGPSKAVVKAKPAVPKAAPKPPATKPTEADVAYGKHAKQMIDFYKADSTEPTPLVLNIHGGGWANGSKKTVTPEDYLKHGISVVSVEYRFIAEATQDGVEPPVKAPLHDAARALQFVRSKAKEWNIDKTRIAATGGSAGACTSLWLAFHDDLADAKSDDPIAHESTRLLCAAVNVPQTSLDPKQMKQWTPNSKYGGHAFGIKADTTNKKSQFDVFLESRETLLPLIKEYSPYELVTRDDPPVYLSFPTPPAMGEDAKDPTHSANFGVGLQEKCKAVGVDCQLVYPGAPDVKFATISEYLVAKLKPKK